MKVPVRALTPSIEDVEESAQLRLADGDVAGALNLIGAAWPRLAARHGQRLRALIGAAPDSEWGQDAWIVAALGSSYRSIDCPSGSAALPYFELAGILVRSGRFPSWQRPAIELRHTAALRSCGQLEAALAMATTSWTVLHDSPEITMPARLTLQAEASLQLGIINLHNGRVTDAADQLRVADGLSEHGLAEADRVECLGALALCDYFTGDFEHAERVLARLRRHCGDAELLASQFGAPAAIAEVLIAVDRNDAATARELGATIAVSAHRSDWEPFALYARAVTAAIGGQLIEALDLQRRCVAAARGWQGSPLIRVLAEILRAGLHRHLGEADRAADLLGAVSPAPDHVGCPAVVTAGIRFETGDFAGCLNSLEACRAIGDAHSGRTMVDILLWSAAANYELGNLVAADVAFDRALYSGSGTGIRVPFLVVPRITMLRMLNRAADRYQPDTVHRLLSELRVGSASSRELVEPLSERELDIAQHLFQDKTVSQIAAELYISANTVKTHVRSIYRKLDASNRKDAIRRVHELGLDVKITPF